MGTKILEFIRENWFVIAIAIAAIVYMIEDLVKRSEEEKVAIAKRIITVSIDAIVMEAETKYADYKKSGNLKRSYTIQTIYEKYPILLKVVDQETLIGWIDELIDSALSRIITELGNERK